jgi:hypothetical protein
MHPQGVIGNHHSCNPDSVPNPQDFSILVTQNASWPRPRGSALDHTVFEKFKNTKAVPKLVVQYVCSVCRLACVFVPSGWPVGVFAVNHLLRTSSDRTAGQVGVGWALRSRPLVTGTQRPQSRRVGACAANQPSVAGEQRKAVNPPSRTNGDREAGGSRAIVEARQVIIREAVGRGAALAHKIDVLCGHYRPRPALLGRDGGRGAAHVDARRLGLGLAQAVPAGAGSVKGNGGETRDVTT